MKIIAVHLVNEKGAVERMVSLRYPIEIPEDEEVDHFEITVFVKRVYNGDAL